MSRNYEEDQKNELEAIESIYYNELESNLDWISVFLPCLHNFLIHTFAISILVIESEYPSLRFTIKICTEEYLETDDGLMCQLQFSLPEKYPDAAPLVEFVEDNFEEHESRTLSEKIKDEITKIADENTGTEMIFTLVAGIQEHMNNLFDGIKSSREEMKLQKEKEIEEAERKRFEGTRVTVETFMTWKTQFELETGVVEKRRLENESNRKLTGRELFMTDSSLVDSDIASILQAGDTVESVKIDESLFQALDLEEDLPSEDESDDPDYLPE